VFITPTKLNFNIWIKDLITINLSEKCLNYNFKKKKRRDATRRFINSLKNH